ncbi:MAG: DUF2975 domain-containing protein [Pseudomonadota bacterium]
MDALRRIARSSRRLGLVFRLGMWLTPVLVATFWLWVGHNSVLQRQLPVPLDPDLPDWAKVWGFGVSMLPGAVVMYILALLGRLFRLYEQGQFFTSANVAIFQRLGWCILIWAASDFLRVAGLGIVLTLHRPAGQRLLVLSLGSDQILMALIGLVVLTIAWVMDEARKIEEDRALII